MESPCRELFLSVKTVQIALFVAVASVLFTLESLVQNPVPWMRLGLANIVTIIALKWWGLKETILIVILRVILGSFLAGKFLHPVFLLSLMGGLAAAAAMSMAMATTKEMFSMVGISIIGSFFKNITQLVLAYYLFVRHLQIFTLLPLFLLSTLVGGFAIGILAQLLVKKLPVPAVK